jgi:hypothetical protein
MTGELTGCHCNTDFLGYLDQAVGLARQLGLTMVICAQHEGLDNTAMPDRLGAAAQGAGRRPETVGADPDPGQLRLRRVGQRAGRRPAHPGPVRGLGRAASWAGT